MLSLQNFLYIVSAARAREFIEHLEQRGTSTSLSREEAMKLFARLQTLLKPEDHNECVICLEDLAYESVRMIRSCQHCFCMVCLQTLMGSSTSSRCPLCRADFTSNNITTPAAMVEAAESANDAGDRDVSGDEATISETPAVKILALLLDLETNEERKTW